MSYGLVGGSGLQCEGAGHSAALWLARVRPPPGLGSAAAIAGPVSKHERAAAGLRLPAARMRAVGQLRRRVVQALPDTAMSANDSLRPVASSSALLCGRRAVAAAHTVQSIREPSCSDRRLTSDLLGSSGLVQAEHCSCLQSDQPTRPDSFVVTALELVVVHLNGTQSDCSALLMEDPAERRDRLKRLREEAQETQQPAPAEPQAAGAQAPGAAEAAPDGDRAREAAVKVPEVKFRNYKPRDDKFAASMVCSCACGCATHTCAQAVSAAPHTRRRHAPCMPVRGVAPRAAAPVRRATPHCARSASGGDTTPSGHSQQRAAGRHLSSLAAHALQLCCICLQVHDTESHPVPCLVIGAFHSASRR